MSIKLNKLNKLKELIYKHFDYLNDLTKEYSKYIQTIDNKKIWSNGEKYFVQKNDSKEWYDAEEWQIKLINLKNINRGKNDDDHKSICYHDNKKYYYYYNPLLYLYCIVDIDNKQTIKPIRIQFCILPKHDKIEIYNLQVDYKNNKIINIDNNAKYWYSNTQLFIQSNLKDEWYESNNWQKNIFYNTDNKIFIYEKDLPNIENKYIYLYENNHYILIINDSKQIYYLLNLESGEKKIIIPMKQFNSYVPFLSDDEYENYLKYIKNIKNISDDKIPIL